MASLLTACPSTKHSYRVYPSWRHEPGYQASLHHLELIQCSLPSPGASLDAAAAWDRLIELALNGCEAGRLGTPAAGPTKPNPGRPALGNASPLHAGLSTTAAPAAAAYIQVIAVNRNHLSILLAGLHRSAGVLMYSLTCKLGRWWAGRYLACICRRGWCWRLLQGNDRLSDAAASESWVDLEMTRMQVMTRLPRGCRASRQ